MGLKASGRGSESQFGAYVEAITSALGHADRAGRFRSYCAGLLLPGERKSVEPMAAHVQPGRVPSRGRFERGSILSGNSRPTRVSSH